jgi:hypothetical protein
MNIIKNSRDNTGLINTIVLIIVALIILGYYKIDVRTIVSAPLVQENLKYGWDVLVSGVVSFIHLITAKIGSLAH